MAPLIFLFSAIFILYVIFGYPLLLHLAARRKNRPIRRKEDWKPVSIILCVYNGEQWIREKLKYILALDYPRELMQILIVSDGSTDGTEQIVREFGSSGVELLAIPRSGKAMALNVGIESSRGEILFFTDVRQPLDPHALKSLVSCLADPKIGAACGHVYFLGDSTGAHMGLYWRYEKWIRNNQTRLDSILAGTGCIYALRREFARPIPANALIDDSYLTLAAFLQGYRFVLDPEAIAYEYPTSLDTEFRRKVRTLAGIYQLIGFLPGLIGPSNRMWIHFVSYKLARLFIPFAMIAMAISGFLLPLPWSTIAIVGQAAFYGLALLDRWIPQGTGLKRLSSVIHTFVVLMAASLCAVSVFFVPPQRLWKETRINTQSR